MLGRQGPLRAPIRWCHRQQGSFTDATARSSGVSAFFHGESIGKGRVGAHEVAAKDERDPRRRAAPASRSSRCQPLDRLVCVGTHALNPISAQEGPQDGSPGSAEGSSRPAVSPDCERSTASAHRSASTVVPLAPRRARPHRHQRVRVIPPLSSSHRNHLYRVVNRPCRWVTTASLPTRPATVSTSPAAIEYSRASSGRCFAGTRRRCEPQYRDQFGLLAVQIG